ncbi:hypothetical protein D3C73_931820 [compost metagenome]
MKHRGGHIAQLPVILVELRALGKARGQHVALIVEAITGHTIQNTVGLHRVDVDELVTLAVPQTVLGALRVATALGQRTVGLGGAFGCRRDVLANQHAHHHQDQHRLHHRPDNPPDRHASGAHDGQFAVAGQTAEADQATDQRGHRQHVVQTTRRGQQHVAQNIDQGVGVADFAHLIDEGEQGRQPENDPQYREDRHEHAATDVAVELNHGPPPARCGDSPSSSAGAPSKAGPGQ